MAMINKYEFEHAVRDYFDSLTLEDTTDYINKCAVYTRNWIVSWPDEDIKNGTVPNIDYAFKVMDVLKTIKTTRAMTYNQFKLLNKFTKVAQISILDELDIKRF